ncbi:MAG: Eco57I restriction-modification methylase domain-containing protein [Clostridiales bacterium]|nr:Eco57I restriction-modification methylase domain-containing protein [Clostridiales bacterium]
MSKALRKKIGQFFTSKETAIFMAELFDIPTDKSELFILDAGAGSGILSIALIERLQSYSTIRKINLVCYENDRSIIDLLQSNLAWVHDNLTLELNYEIRFENYILSQEMDFNYKLGTNPTPAKYDLIIGNPPYMKLAKNAPESMAMASICRGAPNMYALFAAMSAFNLEHSGEMVYIMPRSWTSGAYFSRFREYFFSQCVLEHIHLFINRDDIFENEQVLQETIIIKVRKTTVLPSEVTITTTQSCNDFSNRTIFIAPYETVVSGTDFYVYLVCNESELATLELLNKWRDTLPSIGLRMKTGLTVDFRNRERLRNESDEQVVPLFYPSHIKNGRVRFPIGKENEYIDISCSGLLQHNGNYLFVKRFTSKEEHRRLQCGIYLCRFLSNYNYISTQNKINFIDGLKGLSECVVFGLYVLFNSTLYDEYYRILNGSTQVNSTEINSMPVPPLEIIEEMGKKLIKIKDLSEQVCDDILRSYL